MTNKYYAFKTREECEKFLKHQATKQYENYLAHCYAEFGSLEYDDYLMHWGVPGMKWGQHLFGKVRSGARSVRRTAKKAVSTIKKRASSMAKKIKAKRLLNNAIKNRNKTSKSNDKPSKKTKSISDMSDAELDAATRRLQKENTYKSELAKQSSGRKQSFGSRLSEAAKEGLAAGVKGLITSEVQNVGKKLINDLMEDPNTAKLKTVSTQKKIKEAEIWIKEVDRTGKIPAWDDRMIKVFQSQQKKKKAA